MRRPTLLPLVAVEVLALLTVSGCGKRAADVGPEQSVTLSPRPFVSTMTVSGAIGPGDAAEVAAPFEGVVKAMRFDYGQRVEKGAVLLELDAGEIAQRRKEAAVAFLKASQAATDMADWSRGPDMGRARRGLEAAQFDLSSTRRKADEARRLLDRGLIARSEYEGLLEQQHGQEASLASAQQELTSARERGAGSNREVAGLELGVARARLTDLDARLAGAVVRAPVSGVIVRPPADKADAPVALHVGSHLAQAQSIGAIASPQALAVVFKVDEADAGSLRPGQAVRVTGPGFRPTVLTGRIASVAGEAMAATSTAGAQADFRAVARLDPLSPDAAAVVRIGMTADVAVDLYRNPSALIVPPAALRGTAPAATVRVRAPDGGVREAPVRVGRVAPDGVEILSGLRTGDVVLWPAAPKPAVDGPAP